MRIRDIIAENFLHLAEEIHITQLGRADRPWYTAACLEKFPWNKDNIMDSEDWDSFADLVGTHLASGNDRHVWTHRTDPNLVVKTPAKAYGRDANELEHNAWQHWRRTKFKQYFCPVRSLSSDHHFLVMERAAPLAAGAGIKLPRFMAVFDYHAPNFGVLPDGRPVILDYDEDWRLDWAAAADREWLTGFADFRDIIEGTTKKELNDRISRRRRRQFHRRGGITENLSQKEVLDQALRDELSPQEAEALFRRNGLDFDFRAYREMKRTHVSRRMSSEYDYSRRRPDPIRAHKAKKRREREAAEQAAIRRDLLRAARVARGMGLDVEKSTDRQGNVSSYYIRTGRRKIRISDHDIPATPQRDFMAGGSFDGSADLYASADPARDEQWWRDAISELLGN